VNTSQMALHDKLRGRSLEEQLHHNGILAT